MPASRLSAQEYIQQLRAQRNQKQEAVITPNSDTVPPSEVSQPVEAQAPAVPVDSTLAVPPPAVEKTVIEWQAPNRPYKKRDRRYFLTVGTIVFLICLILFFAGQFLPIAVVISVAFLSYVLSSVPPVLVNHQLTNFGLRIDNELYTWDELGRFWFTKKFGLTVLNLELDHFPWRLVVLLGDHTEAEMTALLEVMLVHETPQPTAYEKGAAWLQKMIPLDSE